ncbi:uncharacterized protein N7498_010833 [Penicillium cinerascens]|uniref:Uncharacterized protein n=1 Tax=Penicillium cinerascens TaxID=70096 RepID=A0A9W9J787_9EURO|nr:uncharacterized protein N7498_010833 [Penicillium cinerascens]KAJ5191848.1 hypothetical protein N7498_010833 [Penicillium cinerascens]
MGDAARPDDDEFNQVLQESLNTWSSYLNAGSEDHFFLQQAIDLKSLVCQTPPFLGDGLAFPSESISFACEKKSTQEKGSLVVNGRSTWRTYKGTCDLQPRVLPKQLLLADGSRVSVKLSEDSPFSDWPGVQGLSGYDNGNYLSVLYLAWAYILSARWVELLRRSVSHECQMRYTAQGVQGSSQPNKPPMVQIDLGDDACEEEILWWRALLCSDDGWTATTKYNGHVYLSPWSVSVKCAGMTVATEDFSGVNSDPPLSMTALKYLSRFCVHHRLYAQCSVALAGALFIPFLSGRTVSLPFPKQPSRLEILEIKESSKESAFSIQDLLKEHGELLPKYMTLSTNTWGLRSLLCCTFFNTDIACNLVSAWMNPAFAVLDSISPREDLLAALMANRQPRLGILWLGAILTGLAKSVLRDIRAGMTALDLPASAWTGTKQTFLTSKVGDSDGEIINRDDECRLLFITACEGHDRPPIWPWKPFGFTQLCDTELSVRQHAQCTTHCLEYESWEWILTNNRSMRDFGEISQPPDQASHLSTNRTSVALDDYNYDFFSQLLSEGATRGIFGWLRSTGYPRSERAIYQHSWLDLEATDEEPDDAGSDVDIQRGSEEMRVESWLEGVE